MLNSINQRFIFWISFIFLLLMLYSKSWLPGMILVGNKEEFYTIAFCSFIAFLLIDFNKLINIRFKLTDLNSVLISLLFVTVLISTIVYNPYELSKFNSLSILSAYALILIVFYFLIPYFIDQHGEFWLYFIKIIAHFGFAFSILGAIIYFLQLAPAGKWSFAFVSIIGHPNNTSIVLTITFFPTLYLVYWKWDKLSKFLKIYFISSLFIQVIAQLFTFTRAGIIAMLTGLLIYFIIYYRAKIIFLLPIFAAGFPLFIFTFIQAKGFGSFISRLYLLVPAYEMIFESRSRMLWGYGITNSLKVYSQRVTIFEENIKDPHNTYVTLVLMFGVIFTLILLTFVFIQLYKILKISLKKNIEKDNKLFLLFIFTSITSIMIQGIFDAELIKYDYFTIHYLLILFGIASLAIKKFPSISHLTK